MKNYNTIYSIEQYMTYWNLTEEDAEKMQKHDIIFNKMQDGTATEEEIQKMYDIVNELGL